MKEFASKVKIKQASTFNADKGDASVVSVFMVSPWQIFTGSSGLTWLCAYANTCRHSNDSPEE